MNRLKQTCQQPAHGARLPILWTATLCVLSLLATAVPTRAQVVPAPPTPQIGSSNPVSAEPNVKRPAGAPCTVTLFSNMEFADYSQHSFSYAPTCTGPYSKIVLTGDFTVTAGRQYDRTTELYIGGTNVFFGTTAEPRATLSPSWHVERDITDLTALLASSQSGTAIIYNVVNSTYTGIIYGTVQLQFYPATPESLVLNKLTVPDVVVPLSANGQDQYLSGSTDQLTQTLTLPKNIERAYLDVIAQSQQTDEQWFSCAPSDVAAELENCGSTGFREVEVSIDGTAAGLAPIFPWIYTGGLDPYLWEPTVGVQTLNFKPFRVDLTPFAGVLSDGKQHTVAVSVFNADNYFDVTAAMLLFLDHGSAQVTGAVTSNNLSAAPTPQVVENLKTSSLGEVTGTVLVDSLRNFTIAGYVNTSHGKVITTVNETADFGNYQTYNVDAAVFDETVTQLNGTYSVTHTKDGFLDFETDELFAYPFAMNYNQVENTDGSYTIVSHLTQQDYNSTQQKTYGITLYSQASNETVDSKDDWNLSPSFATVSHTGSSTSSYESGDSLGSCYSRTLTAANTELTGLTDGAACGGANHQ